MQRPSIVQNDGWVHVDDISPNVILYRKIDKDEAKYVHEAMRDVRVIAVIDVKGGVKKTTAAVHIALGLHRRDRGTVLIGDCDQYHSVADWSNEAAREDPANGKVADPWPDDVVVVSSSGDDFHFDLVDAVQEHRPKYLVIDTPPNDEDAALRALLLADVMVMPTGPFEMDIRRLSYGLNVAVNASRLRGRMIEPLALITGAKLSTTVYKKACRYLDEKGVRFVQMPIRDLVNHARAFGTSVPDLNDYDYVPRALTEIFERIEKEN